MEVADRLVGLLGRWSLGRGGRSHGFRCDWHLTDRTVVQSSGHTPQLSQLRFLIAFKKRERERERNQTQQSQEGQRSWANHKNYRSKAQYPAASFYPLIDEVGKSFPGNKTSRPLSDMEGALLQHNLALADDYQRTSAHFRTFKDVVLHSLQEEEKEGGSGY